ncbi:MAG TPA: hypothetical protein VMS73_00125 [Anaerolineaceae bacterium]|nr:hypothetical protein [Anaerolineaceae bacterium]
MIKKPLGKIFIPILLAAIALLFFYVISRSQPVRNQPASLPGTPTPPLDELASLFDTPVNLPPTETRLPNCAPYPSYEDKSTATATPYPGQKIDSSNFVTTTPRPIAHTYDLSPNSKDIDRAIVLVFRCDGTYDQFIIGSGIKYPQDLHLREGDTIIDMSGIGLHPMPAPPFQTSTATPAVANKALTTPTPFNRTMAPYPYPSSYP